jgi:hypothetical protein
MLSRKQLLGYDTTQATKKMVAAIDNFHTGQHHGRRYCFSRQLLAMQYQLRNDTDRWSWKFSNLGKKYSPGFRFRADARLVFSTGTEVPGVLVLHVMETCSDMNSGGTM